MTGIEKWIFQADEHQQSAKTCPMAPLNRRLHYVRKQSFNAKPSGLTMTSGNELRCQRSTETFC
jgi:hypothetical protein